MNMITVLLGATGILLVVALALSIGAMQGDSSTEEVEKLKLEIAALKAAGELSSSTGSPGSGSFPSAPIPPAAIPAPAPEPFPAPVQPAPAETPIASNPDPVFPTAPADSANVPTTDGEDTSVADLVAEIEESERRHREEELRAENERLRQDNQILKNEVGVAWQPKIAADTKNMARAETIKNAMLLARVTQWHDGEQDNFAVIEVLQPDAVQVGSVLAIRRQTGIYGQVKVVHIYPGGQATADPVVNTFLGKEGVNVQPGDELILPPL